MTRQTVKTSARSSSRSTVSMRVAQNARRAPTDSAKPARPLIVKTKAASPRRSLRPQFKQSLTPTRPKKTSPKKASAPFQSPRQPEPWQKSFLWFFLSLTLFATLLFFAGKYFVITKVYCTLNGTNTACTQSLYDATQKLLGQPFLFNNINEKMQTLHSPQLNFQRVSYYKVLPGTLFVNFDFTPALYQFVLPDGQHFTFDAQGDFTIAPVDNDLLTVQVLYAPAIQALSQQRLDLVLAQKFIFLEYFSREKRADWDQLVFRDLNTLEITAKGNTFILDLFDLDNNLQKLFYLQKNWRPEKTGLTIDLRFKLPVVTDPTLLSSSQNH